MARSGTRRIALEVMPIGLVLISLVLALFLIVEAHRRQSPLRSKVPQSEAVAAAVPVEVREQTSVAEAPVAQVKEPERPEWAREKLQEYEAQLATARAEAEAAEREASEDERARQRIAAEGEHWRERELLRREKAQELESIAAELEARAIALEQERRDLSQRRDATRQALVRAKERALSSYAVVPYKGPSGTWRKPIVLDCRAGSVVHLPDGPIFRVSELTRGLGLRSSALAAAVRREAARLYSEATPDGSPSAPYLLFLIRPDGIRSYYEARAALELSGIAFGYELIGQDWDIEVEGGGVAGPDLVTGVEVKPMPRLPGRGVETAPPYRVGGDSTAREDEPDDLYIWPGSVGEQGGHDAPPGRDRSSCLAEANADARGALPSILADADTKAGPPSGARRIPLEPNLRQIPDPRRAARDGPEPGLEGYREIIPGREEARGPVEPDSGLDAIASWGRAERRAPEVGEAAAAQHLADTTLGMPAAEVMKEFDEAGPLGTEPGGPANRARYGSGEKTGLAEHAVPRADARWLDIVVICRADGVLIQPGGFRIRSATLDQGALLVERLKAVAASAVASGDAVAIEWRPRLRFVVEPGGEPTFWAARRQTSFASLDWPATLAVTEGCGFRRPLPTWDERP